MSAEFTREQLKKCVSKVCLTIGWHTSMTTPIDILTDVFSTYLMQLGKSTVEYANGFGMVEPNIDHLALTFRDYHVNLSELEEYVKNVDFVEPPVSLARYPVQKEDHLNFLKPGSKEVVTRPVHIHEHLPPMHPVIEAIEGESEVKEKVEDSTTPETPNPVFKRPAELSPGENFKRPRLLLEDEGRPTREISSVMMTTSGFLSPAREGKLPESRTPITPIDPLPPPVPSQPVLPPPPPEPINKKPTKVVRKLDKKREKLGRELFKPVGNPIKKASAPKEGSRGKKALAGAPWNNVNIKPGTPADPKFNKALAAARLKTEKLNTTITPIPTKIPASVPVLAKIEAYVDKLLAEPDKRKINILKKISVKNENKLLKPKDEIKQESRESSPDLIIDESIGEIASKVHHLSNDITIELVNNGNAAPFPKSPEKTERSYFDDDSPPGTPSTPKTPEMLSQSPPLVKGEKRKRKDKSKVRKMQKTVSPNRLDSGSDLDCPKTPEAHVANIKQEKIEVPAGPPTLPFPFFNHFAGPGLIPPISNPMFPHLPLAPLGMPSFGQPPYMPPVHPGMPLNFIPSIKHEEQIEKPPQPEKLQIPPSIEELPIKLEKKNKEHRKEKKDKIKKKNKKDKIKNKAEKKKLKEEKKDKEKIKKEKREKKKDKEMLKEGESHLKLTLKLGNGITNPEQPKFYKVDEMSPAKEQTKLTFKLSTVPPSESNDLKKLNIKPIVKKEEEPIAIEPKREMSPELAKISALVTGQPKPKTNPPITLKDEVKEESVVHTAAPPRAGPGPGRPRIHPIKTKPTKLIKPQQTMVKDSEGNKVWICPACGKQDDGSPMIGCDDCDAWYHWICVGIQVEPDDSEDWYCRICISKKQEVLQTEKKKKRKKREKKQPF